MIAATVTTSSFAQPGVMRRAAALCKDIVVGTLFTTTPVTAVFLLGWIVRYMRHITMPGSARPRWLMGNGGSRVQRLIGGAWQNLAEGMRAAFVLFAAVLPFTALWGLAWWGGWENSFNKGYEQASVGPLLTLLAAALSLPVLVMLPMAFAHFAISSDWRAFFAWRTVRQLIGRAGWRYAMLIAAFALFALATFALRVSPVILQNLVPGIEELPPDQLGSVWFQLTAAHGLVLFIGLLLLRRWSVRIYERAMATPQPAHFTLQVAYWIAMLTLSFLLVAQIFIGQFFNHGWVNWVNHPFIALPWSL